jgi:hypothetical protein
MLLAHLVGDYVLQWDRLAYWKSRELKGVLVHGLIVSAVTLISALLADAAFWPWALLIGVAHIAIDAAPLWLLPRLGLKRDGLFELSRFLIDQTLHLSVIVLALMGGGYLSPASPLADMITHLRADPLMAHLLGYVFVAMPGWILVEFLAYGLVNHSAPDFATVTAYKYVGTLERWLIATFVLLGQFGLAMLVMVPRLALEGPHVFGTPRRLVYVSELLASLALALVVGLALRQL